MAKVSPTWIENTDTVNLNIKGPEVAVQISYPMEEISGVCMNGSLVFKGTKLKGQ